MRLHRFCVPRWSFGLPHFVVVWALLAMASTQISAQTLRLEPVALSSVPTGATAANPYWQHLVIELNKNVSAGNVISINLPDSVQVADTDGDGSVEDEISIDGDSGLTTGYRSVSGSTPTRIQLVSTTGGVLGAIHVQFPITTPTNPTVAGAIYGPVSFTNGGETTIPAGTLTLSFISGHQLSLATYARILIDGVADTTTNAQGDAYPAQVANLFTGPLPDLVHDDLGILSSNALVAAQSPFANADDTDDVLYQFWWSTTDSLTKVDATTATAAIDSTGTTATATERYSVALSLDVSALAIGTYYLYTTSNLTGTHPLVRSRGVTVRHDPTVLSVGTFLSGDPDWIDSGRLLDFDQGTTGLASNSQDAVTIDVSAVDLDDSASVRLFYSTTGTLDTSSVTTTGTAPSRVISALTGASHVDSTATLKEGVDSTLTWGVAPDDSSVVPAGDYFIYAVITDGTTLSLTRSDTTYRVRHSPLLVFDVRLDTVIATGGAIPARFHTITWNQDAGLDGDFDRDDTALIDLYYSADSTFAIPNGVSAIESAAANSALDTHEIVDSLSATDGVQADNQYAWDLWAYTNPDDGGVPLENTPYYLYGVITGGGTERLVRWEDGTGTLRTLSFEHEPHLTILAPMALVAVDGRRSFEVSWEARDVDDDALIWVVMIPALTAQATASELSWSQLQAAAGDSLWVLTSTDGSLASGAPVSENTTVRFDARPSRMIQTFDGQAIPLSDGEYHAYVVLDPGAGTDEPGPSSLVQRVPGRLTVDGLPTGAVGLVRSAIEILPARRTMEAWRDTTTFAIHPHTDGETVDVVSVFISVDTLVTTVVDQDATTPGVQPFAVPSALAGQTLYDSVKVATDSSLAGRWVMDLVYFEQSGRTFDGTEPLATITLASRNVEGTAQVRVDNIEQRRSAFYRNGIEMGSLAPETGAVVDFLPRGTLAGLVQLQGRTNHAEEVTLMLRENNGFTTVSDSLFEAVNDVNSTKAGIQDSVDAQGTFTLNSVPTGNYHLAVHVDRYLDGHVPSVQVNPGDQITGLQPTVLRDGVSQAQYLLGGDVTGWVDTSNTSSPDNEIDQLDVDFVITYFGVTTSPAHAGALADVDGDSLVWVEDLNMVAANFGIRGVEPSYRPINDVPPAIDVQRHVQPNGNLLVRIGGEGLADTRAYGLRLAFDPSQWRLRGHVPGEWVSPLEAIHAFREGEGLVDLGAAHRGDAGPVSDTGGLAELLFEPMAPSAEAQSVRLLRADLVDRSHQGQAGTWGVLATPERFALGQNSPNPFTPRTALRLELRAPDSIRLTVYDATGQAIRTLLRSSMPAGIHTVYWDGRDAAGRQVASGTYFARLTGRGWQAERKMLLLR
ncbi:MAG: FlgD immunoglobulin-like domain containing protein [Candidatus Latescibacteria bacterium]|nr:FlgD immunoglobulin-like domain containing protein [Candidatus Latescibacterota bacterium]